MANQITTDVTELLVGTAAALKNYTDGREVLVAERITTEVQNLDQAITAEVQTLNQTITTEVQTLNQTIAQQVQDLNQAIGSVQSNVAANMNEAQYTLTANALLVDIVTEVVSELQAGRNTIKFASASDLELTVAHDSVDYTVGHLDQISFTYHNGQISNVVFLDDRTKQVISASVTQLQTQIDDMESQQAMDKTYIKAALSQITGLTYSW